MEPRKRKDKGKVFKRKGRPREGSEIDELKRLTLDQETAETVTRDIKSEQITDIPLSSRTLKGLNKANYVEPTEIQRESIPLALSKRDILGAAKTGSGKTLAFLIPVIETLWKERFSSNDGLGALIISPTRELAYQTFEVLRKIGSFHDMSAGLVIGGKDLKSEQERIVNTNSIVCTPGRLLQHMDETPNFACDNLKILVLDEADRILDLGFAQTMNSIIENLPSERQTLLFSATQTKSVKDLARLSLTEPSYVSAYENSEHTTPQKLVQSYIVCELHEKVNFLFSFLRNHIKSKILFFLSSCKQVKFIYEAFKKMRPGIPLMALYGKQKQLKRVAIYEDFCQRSAAALFATDIAARGLDFPGINWVIQLDCPEDVNTYIHRAGRTARYEKDGQALLILLPNEEKVMIKKLKDRKIPIDEIRINPKKLQDVQKKLSAFCAQDQELKYWAQRSIVSYVRSVFLHSDKEVFDVHKLDVEQYASSLGLLAPPRIRFMKKLEKKITDNREKEKDHLVNRIMKDMGMQKDGEAVEEEEAEIEEKTRKQVDKKAHRKEGKKAKESSIKDEENENDLDDLLVVKSGNMSHNTLAEEISDEEQLANVKRKMSKKAVTKTSLAKKIIRKGIQLNSKIVFDESGEATETRGVTLEKEDSSVEVKPVNLAEAHDVEVGGIDIEEHKMMMKTEDKLDRKRERQRIKDKHRKERLKMKQERRAMTRGVPVAELATLEPVTEDNDDAIIASNHSENENDSESSDTEEQERITTPPPSKKRKASPKDDTKGLHNTTTKSIELLDDEELALRLLSGTS